MKRSQNEISSPHETLVLSNRQPLLVLQPAGKNPASEKAKDQKAWVEHMKGLKHMAKEVILEEQIFLGKITISPREHPTY